MWQSAHSNPTELYLWDQWGEKKEEEEKIMRKLLTPVTLRLLAPVTDTFLDTLWHLKSFQWLMAHEFETHCIADRETDRQ